MSIVINQALSAYKMAHWHVSRNRNIRATKLEHFISEGEGLFREFRVNFLIVHLILILLMKYGRNLPVKTNKIKSQKQKYFDYFSDQQIVFDI